MVALVFLAAVVLMAIFAPLLAPYGYEDRPGGPFEPISGLFWLGTDKGTCLKITLPVKMWN